MELNFKEFGQGEPVIILHGLFGMLDNWQTLGRQLADHFSVFIVDQRNHGRSPHVPEIDYPSMAEDLRHFMVNQWIHHAHIIGHSMGGKTAMEFATRNPDMVDKLVVIDIAPKAYPGGHGPIFEALQAVDVDNISDRKEADEHLKTMIDNWSIRQFLLKNLHRRKGGGYEWKMNLPAIWEDYPKILQSIQCDTPFEHPALFVRGGKSNYIQDEDWSEIQKLFPKARLETIENAGHWVHAEAPDELLKLLQGFLDEE
jgi:pimeloyl-ACP methyl ester carboxylesterase